MRIFKRFTFDAAHRLPDWPDVHGHSYTAEVWLEGPVVDGYVIPERELTEWMERVRQQLDHKYLNDFIEKPTSENIAKYIWNQFASRDSARHLVRRVVVFRPSCSMGVEYEGEDHAVPA